MSDAQMLILGAVVLLVGIVIGYAMGNKEKKQ